MILSRALYIENISSLDSRRLLPITVTNCGKILSSIRLIYAMALCFTLVLFLLASSDGQ
jgi:hypothetical protein